MITLSDYQVVSRDFLAGRTFGCLFDEPGVGKSYPAVAASWERVKETGLPALITAPAYILTLWEQYIYNMFPDARVVIANGTGQDRRTEALDSSVDYVLTSYNNWSAKTKGAWAYPQLVRNDWACYIFDEGHRLRGHSSATTKHVFRTKLATSRNKNTPLWILTGTPFVRDGGDFYTYFHLFDKREYGSYWKFVEDRCIVTKTPWATNVGNIRKSYVDEFTQELAQFSLRRTVNEIPELQDLEAQDYHYMVDIPASVKKMITKAKKEYRLEHDGMDTKYLSGSGALYVAQRKLATSPPTKQKPKIDWFIDFLSDHPEKVVAYVWFKDSAAAVADAVGNRAHLVTGDVEAQLRGDIVDNWKRSDDGVLVATISALKEGISLTEAKHVVYIEHSELPSDIEQTTKRLLRRGQEHIVQVHHVWAKSTVDIAIKRVLEDRNMGLQEALRKWVDDNGE